MEKSLLEIAYEFVSASKEPVSFKNLWKKVMEEAGLSEQEAASKVSRFYTNLMLDGRFVILSDGMWDLRSRQTFDKVHIDMSDVYSEVETSDEDEEEVEEEKEYNEAFTEKNETDEFDSEEKESEDSEENA